MRLGTIVVILIAARSSMLLALVKLETPLLNSCIRERFGCSVEQARRFFLFSLPARFASIFKWRVFRLMLLVVGVCRTFFLYVPFRCGVGGSESCSGSSLSGLCGVLLLLTWTFFFFPFVFFLFRFRGSWFADTHHHHVYEKFVLLAGFVLQV